MDKNIIKKLHAFGQSVWLDSISRSMIKTGALRTMVDQGLTGMTSNPTLFEKAVASGPEYTEQIGRLKSLGKSTFEIYDDLTVADVQDAADVFRDVFERTAGLDGYVSLEINPKLADHFEETVAEGKRLCLKVDRPNVMFKVPATPAGFKAVEELTAAGINVNITLIFSTSQYQATADAYLRGIRRHLHDNGDVRKVRSVASIFVSRIDTVVDALLEDEARKSADEKRKALALGLRGKAGVANAHLSYGLGREIFSSEGFRDLQARGVNSQRVLWGSTGTKNPAYSDIKYVTELMAKETVNTMPEKTFEAFIDHGAVKEALTADVSRASEVIRGLETLGISIDAVCDGLLRQGIQAFDKSFDELLATVGRRTG